MDTENSLKTATENKDLPRSIEITIKQNNIENKYVVNFPNVGQVIDIETRKSLYSQNQYGKMAQAGIVTQGMALDMIDMIATFGILIPQLEKDMRVKFTELNAIDAKGLMSAYKKQFLPWYNQWLNVLNIDDEAEEVKSE
jgi:hypothetical protein